MVEILDQNTPENLSEADRKRTRAFNLTSLFLICFSLGVVVYTILIIRYDTLHQSSPWLPQYTAYFLHGALINFCVIQLGGIIPTLYLRWKKKYAASCYFMIGFIVVAKLLESHVQFYATVFSIFG